MKQYDPPSPLEEFNLPSFTRNVGFAIAFFLVIGFVLDSLKPKEPEPGFFQAIEIGNHNALRNHLRKVNPRDPDPMGRTPMEIAVKAQNAKAVELLLEAKVDIDSRDRFGDTALHHAAWEYGEARMIPFLLKKGASPSIRNDAGKTPLHTALDWGHRAAAKHLLEVYSGPDERDGDGETHLSSAIEHGFPQETVKAILSKGSDINNSDIRGLTPLHHAARSGDMDLVLYLLENGAAPQSRDANGETPGVSAGKIGHTNIAKLLAKGAEVPLQSGSAYSHLILLRKRELAESDVGSLSPGFRSKKDQPSKFVGRNGGQE